MPRLRDYPTVSAYCAACDQWNKRRAHLEAVWLLKVNGWAIGVALALAAVAYFLDNL